MKLSRPFLGIAAAMLFAWSGSLPAAGPAASPAPGTPVASSKSPIPAVDGNPSARIPDPAFRFEPVIEGAQVTHDFVVFNDGGATLKIERVATG